VGDSSTSAAFSAIHAVAADLNSVVVVVAVVVAAWSGDKYLGGPVTAAETVAVPFGALAKRTIVTTTSRYIGYDGRDDPTGSTVRGWEEVGGVAFSQDE
jgi:hypothetical protein